MRIYPVNGHKLFNKLSISTILIALFCSISFSANALTSVTVKNGVTGITYQNFRWVIEEDQTFDIKADQTCISGATADYKECLSLNFHKSYMPVIAQGFTSSTQAFVWSTLGLDPAKRYYISILPEEAAGQAMGGAQIKAGQENVEIVVTTNNLKTAQIRIFVFNDVHPTNNTPNSVGEAGLPGFDIKLEDAGGRYGISGQQIINDVYGNPLGSKYTAAGNLIPGSGNGNIITDAHGMAVIQNLAPAKYGIIVVPPTGTNYVQTSTIEGTQIIDAWVKADEPPYFAEFGPPGPHVFMGFVNLDEPSLLTGGITIRGQVSAVHNSRPPAFDFFAGAPVSSCVVALNEGNGVNIGRKVFAAKCDANSNFVIPNVPPGNYSLSIWDEPLDYIFGQHAITVGTTDLTVNPSLFAWFARLEQSVFYDTNGNGVRDAGEVGMPEVATGIRWRDGTVYQGFPTDIGGEAPYDQVFPFFSWLVAEVDFSRYKATGVTVTVDGGGKVVPGANINPQEQGVGTGVFSRTETGEVLTQAFQGFLGQTSIIEWGKQVYTDAEIRAGVNGGISGIVYYAVTRAEDDPRFAAPEVWEPGIPRIQVELYDYDAVTDAIKDTNLNGEIDKSDVDNYPLGWSTGGTMGPEDFDYHPNDPNFNMGDAIQITTTDSWDDNLPTGCINTVDSPKFLADGVYPTDCFDGLRNYNQIRNGVFDGGYAFGNVVPGQYIVGTGDHRAYKTVKEEDKNVDFGVTFVQPNLLPPVCMGTRTEAVPFEYSLFPVLDDTGTNTSPLNAGTASDLCNEKLVKLTGGKNAAADFFLFTDVPVAGHIMGFILNDLANEFDRNSPTFGEKYSPPFLPVSIRDWKGNVIGRTYSDRWGSFNVLVPSTYTENLPSSSGISPNMLTACMNDPGPIPGIDAQGNPAMVVDPNYQKQYSQFCYTFNYMPGVTTYLDTPVLPIAAFSGIGQDALDCEYQNGTPVIAKTVGSVAGPVVTKAGDTLQIISLGPTLVTNPESLQTGQPKDITRDYGFGTTIGEVTINGVVVPTTTWNDGLITLAIPNSGNLEIIRADGRRTQAGIQVTVGGNIVVVPQGGKIQDTIDRLDVVTGTTVVVPPGTYNEMVVMHKPIKLQGSGALSIITAANIPSNKLQDWDTLVNGLIDAVPKTITLLPKQQVGNLLPEQLTLFTEAGAGIFVLAKNADPLNGGFGKLAVLDANGNPVIVTNANGTDVVLRETVARIDGISVTGSDNGGGIVVNGFANDLEISNNRVYGNFGVYAGGIRVGHPTLINATDDGYANALNDRVLIHNNYVSGNGASNGYGGGISMNHGSKEYKVTKNYVCGNFTQGSGGGIGHIGLGAPDGTGSSLIEDNTIIFNQSFKQQNAVSGGGMFIGGAVSVVPGELTAGAGDVIIDSNLIQGNNAGAGNGGGISFAMVNGRDVLQGTYNRMYTIRMTNNIVVNNVAGLSGGAVSLIDTARILMVNNTIAYNDSTATSGEAFCDPVLTTVCSAVLSQSRIAGVVSYAHSPQFRDAFAASITRRSSVRRYGLFSNARLANNIIWNNRSFFFRVNQGDIVTPFELVADGIKDYGVVGVAGQLNPLSSVLTDTTGTNSTNSMLDPLFVNDYVNMPIGQQAVVKQIELTTILGVQPAFDEGGNFIDIRFGPLSLTQPSMSPNNDLGSNYRITANSSAIGLGNAGYLGIPELGMDIDNDERVGRVDAGADQFIVGPPEVVNGVALNTLVDLPVVTPASTSSVTASPSTGGGCTVQKGSRFDPLLPLLMLLTLAYFIRLKFSNRKKDEV